MTAPQPDTETLDEFASEHGLAAMTVPRGVVSRFVSLLIEEIERLPVRADGALNHRDFYEALKDALSRYEAGEDSNQDRTPDVPDPAKDSDA